MQLELYIMLKYCLFLTTDDKSKIWSKDFLGFLISSIAFDLHFNLLHISV